MMRSSTVTLAILFAIVAVPLRGEVIESTGAGFLVRNTAAINAPPAKVYTALTDGVGRWWDPAHTFSKDARNLSLDAKPGGCFCERLPDGGGLEHMSAAMPLSPTPQDVRATTQSTYAYGQRVFCGF
jgi:hypothetical protein